MESKVGMPKDAARSALRAAEAVRVGATAMSHGHAMLMLVYAVMMSAYLALFAYAGSEGVDTDAVGGALMALVMPPMIIASGLVNGAGERQRGRLRTTPRHWLTVAVFFAMLAILIGWRVLAGGYPRWVVPVATAVTLVIFATRPLAVLRQGRRGTTARAGREPLPTGTRVVTVLLGVLFGSLCATMPAGVPSWILSTLALMLTVTALVSTADWGLRAAGGHWGPTQWGAFGLSSAVLFAIVVAILTVGEVSPTIAVAAGIVIAASLIIAAFLPGREHSEGADGFGDARRTHDAGRHGIGSAETLDEGTADGASPA